MKSSIFVLLLSFSLTLLFACSPQEAGVSGTEREQIQTLVRNYVVQQNIGSEYEITVDKIDNDWARVLVKPAGAGTPQTFVFVRKQSQRPAPAAAPSLAPEHFATPTPFGLNPPQRSGSTPPVVAESGWVIVLGPKANFTKAELDAAGVPPDLRPSGG